MRLRRLDLVRYGRFTGRALDFGEAGRATDVTLVYGENEGGKSTAFAAWLDLLFGLPLQHAYDLVHARRDLLVGAALDTVGGPLDLRRTGQRSGSLTDADGRAIDEGRLSGLLHGLDRDSYRRGSRWATKCLDAAARRLPRRRASWASSCIPAPPGWRATPPC